MRLKRSPYPIRGDLTKVISYADQREIFLSKKEGGKMDNEIDMAGNSIFNQKDPDQVDQATNKKYVDSRLATKLDRAADNDMKNNSIINLDLPTNLRDAACAENVNFKVRDETEKNFVKVDGANHMTGNLDLNDKKIINLATDGKDIKSAANVGYLKDAIVGDNEQITREYKNYVWVSEIFPSPHTKSSKRLLSSTSCWEKTRRTGIAHASALTSILSQSVTTCWLLNSFHPK